MKWITASERLPEVGDEFYICKIAFRDEENRPYLPIVKRVLFWGITKKWNTDGKVTEWLDEGESIPSLIGNEEDEFDLWEEMINTLFKQIKNEVYFSARKNDDTLALDPRLIHHLKQSFTISRKPSSSSLHS